MTDWVQVFFHAATWYLMARVVVRVAAFLLAIYDGMRKQKQAQEGP